MTDLEKEIQVIVMRAIVLPDCPLKKHHAIASRAWLFEKIKVLIEKNKHDKT